MSGPANEETLCLRLKDAQVYGTIRYAPDSRGVIVFAHGFAGHQHDHIFFNGARFFASQGFSSVRFNFYSGKKCGRRLHETSMETYCRDWQEVERYAVNKFAGLPLYAVGHSLGSIVVLRASRHARAAVLWDPPSGGRKQRARRNFLLRIKNDMYGVSFGRMYIIGKELYKDLVHMPSPRHLLASWQVPLKVVNASRSALSDTGKEYGRFCLAPFERSVIEGAGHNFHEDTAEELLFEETLLWFGKYA